MSNAAEIELRAVVDSGPVKRASEIASGADTLEVKSADDEKIISDYVKALRDARLDLEKELDSVTRPIRRGLDALRAMANPRIDAFKRAEALLKGKWHAYTVAQKRLAEEQRVREEKEAREAAARAAESAEVFAEEAPPAATVYVAPVLPRARGAASQLYTVKRWAFVEIVDPVALASQEPSLVRVDSAELLRLFNDARTRGDVDTAGGKATFCGCRMEEKESVGSRR